ncbi:hypothetical protein Q765_11750 [Flavobacterium rivuli WB 3.3-2 = DSM 21788]|uniref:Sugar-binding protein n=1 Tax=Flavobacterium rivuli WB 3.3-2 = DSM 21788 TaxID=1121895 RepID=A0A0A2M1X1_9FLAO|nr:hypothetical protein [Flavobacterium rivuli]KGO86249.1 hypothetical protein Q765_11750 [Flavobacterium rivuli WB 3.3-2 = DSM 21788]
MPYKILIIFLTCTCASVYAQKISTNKSLGFSCNAKRVVVDNGWGEIDLHVFDKKGRLTELSSNSNHSDVPFIAEGLYYKTEYFYNKKHLTELRSYFHDTLCDISKYDYEKDNIVHEVFFSADVSGLKKVREKKYCYERGKLKLIEEFQYYNDSSYFKTEYNYNNDMRLQTERIYVDNDTSLDNFKKLYTDRRFKKTEFWTNNTNGERLIESEDFTYNGNGSLIKHTYKSEDSDSAELFFYKKDIISHAEFYSDGKLEFEEFYDTRATITLKKRYDRHIDTAYKNTYNKIGDLILVEWFEHGRNHNKTIEYEYWD